MLIAGATLMVFWHGTVVGWSVPESQSMAVMMLALGQAAYLFNARSLWESSLRAGMLTGNPAVWISIAVLIVLQIIFTYAPFMNSWFGDGSAGCGRMAGAAGPVGGHLLLGGSRQGIFPAAVSAVLSPSASALRRGHAAGHIERLVELLDAELAAVDEAHLEHLLADGPAVGERGLGHARGLLVPDVFVQRGDHRGRGLRVPQHARCSSASMPSMQRWASSGQTCEQSDRLQEVAGHHRHHHVEFEVAAGSGVRHGRVVADDLCADHEVASAGSQVDLARHDAGTGLQVGKVDLRQTRGRS